MNTKFISDIHLHESRPQVTQAFFTFLREQTNTTEILYILGDFFDAWIGDDDNTPLSRDVIRELKNVSKKGVHVFLMHGNRDFLLGERFAHDAGAELIVEGTVINLYNHPTLLLHGDSLCTADKNYMAFRQQVRSKEWQTQVLSQPLAARRALALQMREKSQAMNSLKAEDIMDVTQEEVIRVMRDARVTRLIHGHTHRPARHSLTIDGEFAERIVLGDWHDRGWVITATQNSFELEHWVL
jgi:UDP-2,3-diacylglucosamine hydrolase